MKGLASKTVLVTGASRGIGEAAARALDAAGARVVLTGRSAGDLELVAAGMANDPVVIPADLAPPGAGTDLARAVLAATEASTCSSTTPACPCVGPPRP